MSALQLGRNSSTGPGTLDCVAIADQEFSVLEELRVGRSVLDGASFDWVSNRTGLSLTQVSLAWDRCRHRLSVAIAATEENVETLTTDQLRSQSEICVRLLLGWQEDLQRIRILQSNNKDGDDASDSDH